MRKIIILVILSFLSVFFPFLSLRGVSPRSNPAVAGIALAAEQPRDANIFGIHILEVSDTQKAAELVNSSGGDWGWVTMVIRDDDMDFDKWQNFMDDCRTKHLVPIIRIATHLEGFNWAKPNIEDANKWSEFLGNLNWPTKDRHVIIFNEPNHAKEWGGEINPGQYARILAEFISKLKSVNVNFKILNAGLDLAAPNGPGTMEAFNFIKEMNFEVPGIFDTLDGWSSHSYANHGFKGFPWEYKKVSIRGYEFELDFLKKLGVKKQLPVYITETGWPKSEISYIEKTYRGKKYPVKQSGPFFEKNIAADYIDYAFRNIWLKDEKVVAITPFVLNYPADLFYAFSWIDKNGVPYEQFTKIRNIEKINWRPEQETKLELVSISIPPFLPENTEYKGKIVIKNTGQSILGEYENKIASFCDGDFFVSDLSLSEKRVKPGEKVELDFILQSKNSANIFLFSWEGTQEFNVRVLPASFISQARYSLWEKVILKIESIFKRN